MRKRITLACSKCKNKNYRLNKTTEERFIINKFCSTCNKHTLHKEEK